MTKVYLRSRSLVFRHFRYTLNYLNMYVCDVSPKNEMLRRLIRAQKCHSGANLWPMRIETENGGHQSQKRRILGPKPICKVGTPKNVATFHLNSIESWPFWIFLRRRFYWWILVGFPMDSEKPSCGCWKQVVDSQSPHRFSNPGESSWDSRDSHLP